MQGTRGWLGSVGFALAYSGAMLLGRALPIDGQTLSVVWPACGVAVLWLFAARRQWPVVDLLLLAVATYLVNDLTGASSEVSLVFVAVNLVQACLAVWLVRRLVPELWGSGGRETIDRLRPLFLVLAIAAVSSGVAALVAAAGLAQVGTGTSPTLLSLALHWGRNTFGLVLVVTVAHLLAHTLWFADRRLALVEALRRQWAELLALVAVSTLVYAAVFAQSTLPLAFAPMTATLWAGLRFPSVVVAVHGALASVAALTATLLGTGPLAPVENDLARGLLIQLLMSLILVEGLALAAGRHERELLLRRVEATSRASGEQAAVLATVIESMSQGVAVLDGTGRVVRANDAARRVMQASAYRLGIGGAEPYGEAITWEQVWELITCEPTTCAFDLVLQSESSRTVVQLRATPLRGGSAEGAQHLTVVMLDDVTADRAAREELTSFASSVAHDLRTPLTAVRGWAEQLRDITSSGQADAALTTAMLDRVVGNAERMQELIRDLLEHATTQGAEVELRLTSVSQMMNDVADSVGVLETTTVERTPLVRGDKAMLRQLLLNLTQNAAKYVAPGVVPRLHLAATTDGELVRFTLTDNGVGVDPADRERIFKRFVRGASEEPGTGLGLAICRTIVERHGGTIHVESGPGGLGSDFVFTLPAASQARLSLVQPADRGETADIPA